MNIDSEKPATADFASKRMLSSNSKHDITTLSSSTKFFTGPKKEKQITSHDFRVSPVHVKESNFWSDISDTSVCPCDSSAMLGTWSVRKIKLCIFLRTTSWYS